LPEKFFYEENFSVNLPLLTIFKIAVKSGEMDVAGQSLLGYPTAPGAPASVGGFLAGNRALTALFFCLLKSNRIYLTIV
jgi:hypothetical protein